MKRNGNKPVTSQSWADLSDDDDQIYEDDQISSQITSTLKVSSSSQISSNSIQISSSQTQQIHQHIQQESNNHGLFSTNSSTNITNGEGDYDKLETFPIPQSQIINSQSSLQTEIPMIERREEEEDTHIAAQIGNNSTFTPKSNYACAVTGNNNGKSIKINYQSLHTYYYVAGPAKIMHEFLTQSKPVRTLHLKSSEIKGKVVSCTSLPNDEKYNGKLSWWTHNDTIQPSTRYKLLSWKNFPTIKTQPNDPKLFMDFNTNRWSLWVPNSKVEILCHHSKQPIYVDGQLFINTKSWHKLNLPLTIDPNWIDSIMSQLDVTIYKQDLENEDNMACILFLANNDLAGNRIELDNGESFLIMKSGPPKYKTKPPSTSTSSTTNETVTKSTIDKEKIKMKKSQVSKKNELKVVTKSNKKKEDNENHVKSSKSSIIISKDDRMKMDRIEKLGKRSRQFHSKSDNEMEDEITSNDEDENNPSSSSSPNSINQNH